MVIVLNGTTSAGKTSVAELLQVMLPQPYLYAGIDHFFPMLPPGFIAINKEERNRARQALAWVRANPQTGPSDLDALAEKWRADMRCTIAYMVSLGNNIIVDEILTERAWVDHYLGLLPRNGVLWVGLHCPIEYLEQRERERGRSVGQAGLQAGQVHAHVRYDLELDTGSLSPYECASRIVARLSGP